MSFLALGLLLLTALLHAGWNVLLKQAADQYLSIWWALAASAAIGLPIAFGGPPLPPAIWPYAIASAFVETLYYLLLARAYRTADFSLVYPIARGAAPALLATWAILFLGEAPRAAGLAGLAVIIGGLLLVGARRRQPGMPAPGMGSIGLALAIALCISVYSAIDGAAVRIAPSTRYTALVFVLTALMMTPFVVRRYGIQRIAAHGRLHGFTALLIGALSLAAYALVLAAYALAPVSYVGAIREISVVIGALAGSLIFREPFGARRGAGAAVIFTGIMIITFAG
jgi:drug/metabolite transporter (DMT)-like permease